MAPDTAGGYERQGGMCARRKPHEGRVNAHAVRRGGTYKIEADDAAAKRTKRGAHAHPHPPRPPNASVALNAALRWHAQGSRPSTASAQHSCITRLMRQRQQLTRRPSSCSAPPSAMRNKGKAHAKRERRAPAHARRQQGERPQNRHSRAWPAAAAATAAAAASGRHSSARAPAASVATRQREMLWLLHRLGWQQQRSAPPVIAGCAPTALPPCQAMSAQAAQSCSTRADIIARLGPCADLLAEAVLEAARQVLLVAHAAGAAVLPADHLLAPLVVPVAGRRVAAGAALLELDVERGAAAAAAGRVRLLDLLLEGLLRVRHLGRLGGKGFGARLW